MKKGGGKRGKGSRVAHRQSKIATYKREQVEIRDLERRVEEETPPPGSTDLEAKKFEDLPISRYTLKGLNAAKFTSMTEIQRSTIPHALAGRDILGAAKTGSGKTLAFLVPVLERLFRAQWSTDEGLGALIISPTRELAMQIMEVLAKVARGHAAMSAGLVCGGKDFAEEQALIGTMSILVATPGRLLQHLEQTSTFSCDALQLLVLDEADRLLDMGFKRALDSILSYLPSSQQRQTMLFSATQTKSIKSLARLSLRSPEYIAVHEQAASATPKRLIQAYVVVELQDKLSMLWSFVKTHLKNKTIVFLSSTKQVRFAYEVLRRLRPGVPVLELHGKIKQTKRMVVYKDFVQRPAAVLLATDIAARGLDFPAVDWVLQLDCPDDVEAYVHRVGRTARFRQRGNGLLCLLPSEAEPMLKRLQEAKVALKRISVSAQHALNVTAKVGAQVAADSHLKYLAQRAFVSYVRSVVLQPDKQVFDAAKLPLDKFAASLGLPSAPRVKIAQQAKARDERAKAKNESWELQRLRQAVLDERSGPGSKEQDRLDRAAFEAAGGADSDEEDEPAAAAAGKDDDDDEEEEEEDQEEDQEEEDSDDEDDGELLVRRRGGKPRPEEEEEDDEVVERRLRLEAAGRAPYQKDLAFYDVIKTKKVAENALRMRMEAKERSEARAAAAAAAAAGGGGAAEEEAEDPSQVRALLERQARRARAQLAAVDARDKELNRQRLRERRRRRKLRAMGVDPDAVSDEEEEEEDGGFQVTLGGAGDDDEEEAGAVTGLKRPRSDPQDEEAVALALLQRRRGAAAGANAGDDEGEEAEEEAAAEAKAAKRSRKDKKEGKKPKKSKKEKKERKDRSKPSGGDRWADW